MKKALLIILMVATMGMAQEEALSTTENTEDSTSVGEVVATAVMVPIAVVAIACVTVVTLPVRIFKD